jgi:hypothetical protein
MTPAKKDAFRMKLDRKFNPIPAFVAQAAKAGAKLDSQMTDGLLL